MNLDDYLDSIELVDCTGQRTHRLTLQVDGRVKVNTGGTTATVDPLSRTVEPPMIKLGRGEYGHDQIIDVACNLAVGR